MGTKPRRHWSHATQVVRYPQPRRACTQGRTGNLRAGLGRRGFHDWLRQFGICRYLRVIIRRGRRTARGDYRDRRRDNVNDFGIYGAAVLPFVKSSPRIKWRSSYDAGNNTTSRFRPPFTPSVKSPDAESGSARLPSARPKPLNIPDTSQKPRSALLGYCQQPRANDAAFRANPAHHGTVRLLGDVGYQDCGNRKHATSAEVAADVRRKSFGRRGPEPAATRQPFIASMRPPFRSPKPSANQPAGAFHGPPSKLNRMPRSRQRIAWS